MRNRESEDHRRVEAVACGFVDVVSTVACS